MKKYLSLNNFLFFLGATYLALTTLPVFFNNLKQEGQKLKPSEHIVIKAAPSVEKMFFPSERRSIAIFWATWCAPCKLEMNRLASSISEGKIPAGTIVAINPFESTDTIRLFLKDNSFPFTFIEDQGISNILQVSRTPTTVFLENTRVMSISSGLSFIGIWKAEQFL